MTTLMTASHQWATRPDDERFVSLLDLQAHTRTQRERSVSRVLANRDLRAVPIEGDTQGLAVEGPNGGAVVPTNWAFGQLASLAGAPAGYVRKLPAPLAADCINYGLATRDVEECGVMLRKGSTAEGLAPELAAATGPNYGRVWNHQVADALVSRFGDGVSGDFKVPGEFGKAVEVTKRNTTLYASDRDMWVFLADESRRIEVPGRRDGKSGSLARGFFVWNSEVGAATLGLATFLFDYVCCNRIVWGATQYRELKMRHTSGAPHRWVEQAVPQLEAYAQSSTHGLTEALATARATRLGAADKVATFLATRFGGKAQARAITEAHLTDEGRPIETLWDAVTGATAYARSIPHQGERVAVERLAGGLLEEVTPN